MVSIQSSYVIKHNRSSLMSWDTMNSNVVFTSGMMLDMEPLRSITITRSIGTRFDSCSICFGARNDTAHDNVDIDVCDTLGTSDVNIISMGDVLFTLSAMMMESFEIP